MGKASSSSSSSISSGNLHPSTASSRTRHNGSHPTDLRLGLSISASSRHVGSSLSRATMQSVASDWTDHTSFFVKVYMEGVPIGRKLDILAHGGYHELVRTLEHMFDTTILWGTEMDGVQLPERCHVLTYEDDEGDLVMVGDVPWEMFLSTVKKLKITRVDPFGC